ncbi:MAG: 2-dehydropantoate 2-reductase [Betaproteobacteria bacterium]|jgi:2-dehydropantoate 2-reductase|nr:2-dehydropantoate 2-reductase [Betaproteobacteria bacterium]
MKIAVMGSGGVGGFYGGRLAHTGCDVHFVARGAHLAAMREHGLTIENKEQGDINVAHVNVTEDPSTIGIVDLVIIAVKLKDTEAAALAVKPIVGPQTALLSLQNGVIKDDILRKHYPAAQIMGGVAYVATHVARPGVILQVGPMQRVVFGEYDGKKSARAEALLAALLAAGIKAELSGDIRRTLWEKYTFLVGLSGTTTTMRTTIGPIRAHPRARAFLHSLFAEVVAVGRAHGVDLPADYADDRLKFAHSVPATMTSSMHHDLERGNPLEVEWLAGGVVTLGEAVGIATPANRAVWDILSLYSEGRTAVK